MEAGKGLTQFLVVLCCVLSQCYAGTAEIYVDPVAENCSSINCSTLVPPKVNTSLDEALENISSNTTLYLKPGCHCVQNFIFVENHNNVSLVGMGDKANVNITCAHGLGLAFFNVSELTFANMTIDDCGLTGPNLSTVRHTLEKSIDLFFHIHDDFYIAMLCGGCHDFSMRHCSVTNTKGLGFLGVNLIGDSQISHSDFSMNSPPNCFYIGTNLMDVDRVGGGAMLLYLDYFSEYYNGEVYSLAIENSQFLKNSYCGPGTFVGIYYEYSETFAGVGYPLGAGGGLSLIMAQLNYSVDAGADGCMFRNNTARYGGGAHVEIFAGVSDTHVEFSDCLFEKNGLELFSDVNLATSGAAFALFKDFVKPYNTSQEIINIHFKADTVRIGNTIFRENKAFSAGAVLIRSIYSPVTGFIRDTLLFDNCTFENNIALLGAAMFIEENKQTGFQPGIHVKIRNTTVSNNEVYVDYSTSIQTSDISSVIDVVSVNMTLENSEFTDNLGSVLRTSETIIHIEGKVEFSNNVGIHGGAMRLLAASILILGNDSTTVFHNNSAALSGGAIYVSYLSSLPSVSSYEYDCFLFFDRFDLLCYGVFECVNITATGAQIQFRDNKSPLGGTIFGSIFESCPWRVQILDRYPDTNMSFVEILDHYYSSIFHFNPSPDTTKVITTPTNKIIIDDPQSGPYDIAPGEEFSINITAFDRLGRAVPAILASKPSADGMGENVSSVIGQTGYWFIPGTSQAPITVYGVYNQENINITVLSLDSSSQAEFTVNLLNCTYGFVYHSSSCICEPKLEDTVVSCNSSSKTLSVPSDKWVGPGPKGKLVVTNCIQADYCRLGSKVVKPPDFDSQCTKGFKRTGLLCGKCVDGYSSVFGTNRCLKCKNIWLIWILVLACAGVGIVLAISFFKISITGGYLNGMLFYCNVVSLYLPFFTSGSSVTKVFVLIAFLNLDLGIESCFYNGMDSLTRAGLQFVFPAYLWILMLCITLLARKSHRVARRFSRSGYSASQLFATLMLMSYSSLTETCIEILGFVSIPTISGDVYYRWRVDPNQLYFHGAHIPLFLLSIVLLIFYIIPAPFLLIFPSYTLKIRFLKKLAPIYDAFWAPFKPRYRYWVGLRLLLRGIPFIFVYFIPHPLNVLLLGIFLLILLYVQGLLQPFDGIARNAFDTFFIINILALVMASLYFTIYTDQATGDFKARDSQYAVFCVIVTCAYIEFGIIHFWHILLRYPALRNKFMTFLNKLKHGSLFKTKSHPISKSSATRYGTAALVNQTSDDCELTSSEKLTDNETNGEGVPIRVVFSELREPLLDEGSLELMHHSETT